MPNHVENELTVRGDPEILQEFTAFALEDGVGPDKKSLLLSADRFVPMPEEVKKTESGNFGSTGYAAWYGNVQEVLDYRWIKEAGVTTQEELQEFLRTTDPQYEVQANLYQSNLEKFGSKNWYDWSMKNWGTKWGIYDAELIDGAPENAHLEYVFLTAWSPPGPIIEAMAARFPGLLFELRYYESGGGFQGVEIYEGGESMSSWSGDYHGTRGG